MEQKEFKLHHVALYAKNWYQKSDNIWFDLAKCLEGDGYNIFYNDYNDNQKYSISNIYNLILNKTIELFSNNPNNSKLILEIINDCAPNNRWKIDYNEYNNYYEVVIRSCLSKITCLSKNCLSSKTSNSIM